MTGPDIVPAPDTQAPVPGEDPDQPGPGGGGTGGGPAESGPPPEHLGAPLEHRSPPAMTKLQHAHTSCVTDDRLPDAGEGACCIGAALYGPGRCTCWARVYDLDQQLPDVQAARWLASGIQPNTRATMCGDCAYRPGSPEKLGDTEHAADAESLEGLALAGDRFWCHQGMRRPVTLRHPSGVEIPGHEASYDPPVLNGVPYRADGQPGELCAGWAARARALGAIQR